MINLPPGGILTKPDLFDDDDVLERPSLDGEDIKLVLYCGLFKMGCAGDESGVVKLLNDLRAEAGSVTVGTGGAGFVNEPQ